MFDYKRVLLTIAIVFLSILPIFANDFTIQKLPNGQTLVIQEVKNNPIVTIDTWVKTGSINETDVNSGVAHFLEHLFFKGTKLHPAGDADRILESKGAIVNAATSKDFTHYYITIPSNYFDVAMELHADMLTNPQIPRKELEKERKVVLEEIAKDGNTPSKIVYNNLNDLLYTQHPYKRKVIGSADVISNITREEILEYFNDFYAPSNMVTLVVGDVDSNKIMQKVTECFNTEFKKPIKKVYRKEHPLQTQKRKIEYLDTQSGYLMMGFRGVPIANSDTYALDVLSQIFGDGKTSRLYRNIKEQKNIAYSISSANGSYRDDGIFYITANYQPANEEKLEKAIFNEIEQIQKYGVTEEELKTAKNMIEQDTYYSRESTSNISSELGYIITLTNSPDFYRNYVANIKKISAKEVQAVAQKYLGKHKCAVSIALPKNVASTERNDKKHSGTKVSSYDGVDKYLIDNSSTLLVSKHQNNDIIAITIIAKGGEFLENIQGEGVLTAGCMLKGTQKYSSQELAQLMEENGIKIVPSSQSDYFVINVQTTTAQLDLTLELLDEIINNSTFDDNEIEKKRSEILLKIKQQRDVPMNIALENYKSLIYGNNIYSHTNLTLEKTLPSVNRENILDYYNKILDSKNIVISVNGNVEEQKLISAFGNIFKNTKQPQFKYSDIKISGISSPKVTSKTIKDLQASWLFLGWPTLGINNQKDFVTLKVINTILGSGLSSRLYKNLREQNGLAYQLGSTYNTNALAGNFMTYIGTKPETLNVARTGIRHEIERLKMEFVSDSELQDAKDRLIGSFVIAMETNSQKASTLGTFEALGFGYDFLDKYVKMINEVTASDINKVANKYFNGIYVDSSVK